MRWRLATSKVRLPVGDLLAEFKTANKLRQVVARAEAEAQGADEALLLNTSRRIAETASGNIFWIKDRVFHTPPADAGILPGVTRGVVMQLCRRLDFPVREEQGTLEQLKRADGIFVTLSTLGVVEVAELDGHPLKPMIEIETLRKAYEALVAQECA
jgi:branched-subunit amino acid aminotransferase/4-amino-4-deoxychorismate lyase